MSSGALRWMAMIAGSSAASVVLGCASAPDRDLPYESDLVFSDAARQRDDQAAPRVDVDAAASDADRCSTIATGCSCPSENEQVACGTVHEQFGDYVRCTPSYRTCSG